MESNHSSTHSQDTPFVRLLTRFFRFFGAQIARRPLIWLGLSTLLTLFCAAKIPFTPLANDVSDFTPSGARARQELQRYKDFFSSGGEPLTMYLFVTAKNDGNMLGLRQLEEAVRLLTTVSEKIQMNNPITGENLTFTQFCTNFCTINEPVRHFYNGLLVGSNFDNSTEHIDLGYPITTVLGRQLHMDPNFFGVKIAVQAGNITRTVSVNKLRSPTGKSLLSIDGTQVRNNIREIKLVGLQFRAELPEVFRHGAAQKWEDDVINFARKEFTSEYVDVLVISETFLTNEVVRSGLTLIPFLAIGFVIMCIFSTITMGLSALYMDQLGLHNVVLAVMACVCPFMAVGTALGGMFWFGFRFGSILCVTPFLVLAIGVDDAYLMINAWQAIRKRIKNGCTVDGKKLTKQAEILEHLMIEVMVDTGPSISITTITNFLAFMIGIFTPTPEIQLFSIGNALAIIMDYIYQWTVFGSFMVLAGRWEFRELDSHDNENGSASKTKKSGIFGSLLRQFIANTKVLFNSMLTIYCRMLSNTLVASLVIAALAGYVYICVYGVLEMRSELRPEQLFIEDSDIIKVLALRNTYIIPFYAVCLVFVNNPGNFSDPSNIQRLTNMVTDFEKLPSSLGSFATKYFIRDYEEFIRNADESSKLIADELAELEEEIGNKNKNGNELKQFLEWPEFQFWNGFVRLEPEADNPDNLKLKRFFFTIASHGTELRDWSKRAELLQEWRNIADSYPEFEVSVYEDDAKFLDLIPTMIPQTIQSAFCTLVCMFLVCLLFIRQPTAVIVANFSIFSICVGVFGILSLMGVELDPIVLSSCIMSIGFSVDIPAHITYHYYKLGMNEKAKLSVEDRLRECLSSIGFPILEAGFSTILCVLSLTFVELHMAQVFAKTMVLVVALGLIHGLLVIPVMLYLISLIPFGNQPFVITNESELMDHKMKSTSSDNTSSPLKPICLEVNLKM